MTGLHPPASSASPRLAGFVLVALLSLVAILPPEVHGSAFAGAAALAVVVAALAPSTPAGALVLGGAAAVLTLVARFAAAPGEAVEPAALVLLAATLGLATARLRPGAALWGAAAAALAGVLGARAVVEVAWGHEAAAAALREGSAIADASAVLNRLEQGRAYGGFSTPAALAGFLVLLLAPAAAWTASRRGAARLAGLAGLLLGAAGLVATRSLTALASLAAAIALAALRRRVGARALAASLGVVALIALAVALARPDGVFSLARQDSPWRLRAGNVRVALEVARANPAIGVGPGGYAEAFPAFRREGDNESRFAHDLPAQLAAEWGIAAGLALGALFFALFLGPILRGGAGWRDPAGAVALGLAAFALHNLADFTAFLPTFAVAVALLRGSIAIPREAPAAATARAATAALAIVAGVACGRSALSRDALLDARDAAAAGERSRLAARAARAAQLAPWDCDARLAAAQSLPATDALALAHADAAVAASPVRASARAARAEIRASQGEVPGAYADLVRAAELHPLRAAYAARRDEVARVLERARGSR